ncbi:hypothetical protein GGR51DRAFT_56862 [Nemania sp. FL0031]|nr:hypothetical protein GGR51DRAFT_56862 [Nemania sp. FL0031]
MDETLFAFPKSVFGWAFACPFYLHDQENHQSCPNKTRRSISDVFQHIKKCHMQRPYCTSCGSLFEDDSRRDLHMESCKIIRTVTEPSGMTPDQLIRMDNALCRWITPDIERWYGIWDLMFPGAARPDSPYIYPEIERTKLSILPATKHYRQNGGFQHFFYPMDPSRRLERILIHKIILSGDFQT